MSIYDRPLEMDQRWFKILAQSPNAAIVLHIPSGKFSVWRLQWREYIEADRDNMSEKDAWTHYLRVM